MVFLIQRSQNKDSLAIHLKLNELVAAMNGASNRLIEVENRYPRRSCTCCAATTTSSSSMAKRDATLTKSHSVEEAENRHKSKAAPKA